jgi:hypothetical protein
MGMRSMNGVMLSRNDSPGVHRIKKGHMLLSQMPHIRPAEEQLRPSRVWRNKLIPLNLEMVRLRSAT